MKKVFFDSRKCLGCHSCEFACAVEHSKTRDPARAHLEDETPRSRRVVRMVEGMCLTVACHHCEPAPCVEACIAGALCKEDGFVRCDADKCVGCWMCVMVCPFGAIRPGSHVSLKCDFCPDRSDSQACVAACPTGALFLVDLEEYHRTARENKNSTKAVPQP